VRKAEEKAEKAHDKTKDEVKNLKAALQARGQTAVRHEQVLAEQKEATAQSTSTLDESNRTLEESNRKLESKVARMEEAKKVATAKAAEDTVRYKDALGARVSQHEHTTHQKVELEGEVARLKTKLQEVKDTVRARGTKVADLEYEVRQLLLVPRGRGVWKEPKAGGGGRSGRQSQRQKLIDYGAAFFSEKDIFWRRVAELVACELLHKNKAVEEAIESSVWFQAKLRAMATATLASVQERMEHAGLAIKVIGRISWGCYKILRRVLSFDFEEPDDLTYEDAGDIGIYRREMLYLQPDARSGLVTEMEFKMPVLPTYDACRAEEDAIVSTNGGYHISRDGKTVTKDFASVLRASLVLHWELVCLLTVVVLQVFGDGFQMFRAGKYVNFCLRVCGVHQLSGNAASCETLEVWAGNDIYQEVEQRVSGMFDIMAVVSKTKQFNTRRGV
jgi:hypothetical protein